MVFLHMGQMDVSGIRLAVWGEIRYNGGRVTDTTGGEPLRKKIFEYAERRYGTRPEYLWEKDPTSAVLRNSRNRKWYAVFMNVSRERLGSNGTGAVEVMDVKADPDLIAQMVQAEGFLPGYHMNKKFWMTVLLDGSVSEEKVLDLLDMSYSMVDTGKVRQ